MVTNVTSLLKTVKAVEDEHTRGTRALESTIEVIGQEIRVQFIILKLNIILNLLCTIYLYITFSNIKPNPFSQRFLGNTKYHTF